MKHKVLFISDILFKDDVPLSVIIQMTRVINDGVKLAQTLTMDVTIDWVVWVAFSIKEISSIYMIYYDLISNDDPNKYSYSIRTFKNLNRNLETILNSITIKKIDYPKLISYNETKVFIPKINVNFKDLKMIYNLSKFFRDDLMRKVKMVNTMDNMIMSLRSINRLLLVIQPHLNVSKQKNFSYTPDHRRSRSLEPALKFQDRRPSF
jgi:hypothetical protein